MRKWVSFVALVVGVCTPGFAGTYRVPENYPTIQEAIDACEGRGDCIIVRAGEYPEHVQIGDEWLILSAPDGPAVTSFLSLTWNQQWSPQEGESVLAGFAIGGPVDLNLAYAFRMSGCDISGVIDADLPQTDHNSFLAEQCTFRNDVDIDIVWDRDFASWGKAQDCDFLDGANLRIRATYAVRVIRCHFEGGGVELRCETNGDVTDCVFHGVGGIHTAFDSGGRVEGNVLTGGPGIRADHGSFGATVMDNLLRGCTDGIVFDDPFGGPIALAKRNALVDCARGIRLAEWDAAASNVLVRCGTGIEAANWCTIDSNTVVASLAGVRLLGRVDRLNNNLLMDCDAGVVNEDSGQPREISCNDVFNSATGNWIGLPDPTGIHGNISLDPRFCLYSELDYTLASDSPCLPGNHPDGPVCGVIGAHGLGCDEPSGTSSAGDGEGPAQPDDAIHGLNRGVKHLTLARPAPNTSRESQTLRFALPQPGHCRISVHAPSGRTARVVLDEALDAGWHARVWDGRDANGTVVPAGVYFIRVSLGGQTSTRALLRLR